MHGYLAPLSRRDTRRYAERAVPEAAVRRVLEAGRLAAARATASPGGL